MTAERYAAIELAKFFIRANGIKPAPKGSGREQTTMVAAAFLAEVERADRAEAERDQLQHSWKITNEANDLNVEELTAARAKIEQLETLLDAIIQTTAAPNSQEPDKWCVSPGNGINFSVAISNARKAKIAELEKR